MPIYTYACVNKDCDEHETTVQIRRPMADINTPLCEVCKTGMERRVDQRVGFRLKGQGWFRDGYSK